MNIRRIVKLFEKFSELIKLGSCTTKQIRLDFFFRDSRDVKSIQQPTSSEQRWLWDAVTATKHGEKSRIVNAVRKNRSSSLSSRNKL